MCFDGRLYKRKIIPHKKVRFDKYSDGQNNNCILGTQKFVTLSTEFAHWIRF